MKLFLFTNFFPYKRAEPFLVNEFQYAKKNASSITVFTLYGKPADRIIESSDVINLLHPVLDSPGNKSKLLCNGIFNRAPFGFHLKEFFNKHIFLSPKKFYWLFISFLITRNSLSSIAFKNLQNEIDASETPVLYFYWGDNLAWIIPYLRKKIKNKSLKIILRLHGSDLYEHLKNDYAPLRRHIFSSTDLIVTVSENGRNYLAEKYPEYKNKLFLSRLGVSDNGLNKEIKLANDLNIVSVSNVVPVKRVKLIFEALQQSKVDITWHHFGDGPLLNELKELAGNRRKGLKIIFHGYISNKELMEFYTANYVDVFINASYSEGIPVSIMEALSFGIPVIATDVGGTSELVDKHVGELIERDFVTQKLADIINRFYNLDKNEIKIKRKNARLRYGTVASAEKNHEAFYKKIKNI